MRYLLTVAVVILFSVDAWAVPYWLITGGSNGTSDKSSIGIEAGGTRVILNTFPLSGELSMNFDFKSVPSDTHFNTTQNEPFTVRKANDGPEIGYLFKSGINLDDIVPNLTLQFGAGYALQSVVPVATGSVSGKHWQQGEDYTAVYPVGYGGILYRVKNICFNIGYNNRRGVVAGVGSTW
jgi:hypothetical protein